MKLRLFAVLAITGALALTGCGKEGDSGSDEPTAAVESAVAVSGSKTFDAMKSRGSAIIGVKEDQPNLGYKDPTTNQYSGFDISIAKLIAAKLGFAEDKIQFKAIPSANREQAIVNGDIDYYVGTYSITDKRKAQISFAGPYYLAGQDLLVRKDDTAITGPDTLKGKTVCSATGSTSIQRIKDEHKDAKTVEFEKYSQCVDALINKQVDAVTTDDAILKGYAAQQSDKLKVVGKPFSEEKYGVGLNKDDKALRDKINDIIEASEKDGQWQSIYDATLGKSGSKATPPSIERY
ncbi:glutamate ABC transporter substrate-binding protein [Cryptosporangium phraense]|uniref:Glutamate ABC transporter substrate-binding protein n=1 Tax=Cryptosporangium phraense TaxID=2593070 RepID=A0A545AU70_9ACTN|nr:glutamate ABC transporter substrate-binding protein [Cryptosporangium phraense]TQS44843.1 glutamate ABC transporter substrate-binding protein [Cryptosporangium phraense]